MSKSNRTFLIIGLAGIALLIGGAVIIGGGAALYFRAHSASPVIIASVAGPSAEREGQNWTHAELFGHLKAAGIVAEMKDGSGGGGVFDPVATFVDRDGGEVRVVKVRSVQAAKDAAGADGGNDVTHWGRFFIHGDKALVASIKKHFAT